MPESGMTITAGDARPRTHLIGTLHIGFRLVVCTALALAHCGCARQRTLEEIEADQRTLPTLYLTEKSNKQIVAPANRGLFVDEATGEICYQPFECLHPQCPGKSGDKPVLFVHRDVLVSLGPDRKFVYQPVPADVDFEEFIRSKGGQPVPTCPHCLKNRKLESETPEEKLAYQKSVRPYEMPETTKRREELKQEHQQAYESLKKRRQGG
jgi:hypothetical protein